MPKLSAEKRIILHLSKYSNFEEAWEVPIDISQEGISQKLNILQNNVSRAINSLKNEELVYEKLSYIKKGKRRRKTYFLTEKGKELAKNFEKELLLEVITYRDKGNEIKKEKASRVLSILEKEYNTKVNLQDIFEYLMKKEIFDFEDFLRKGVVEKEKKFVKLINYTEKAPKLYHFFGREKELEEIKNCISSKNYGIIVIQGIAGIGKTTFALKLIEEYKNKKNLFWYRFHDWDSIRNIITSISQFLYMQNKKKLSYYLKKKILDLNEIGNILEIELNNCILFFDDFHIANNEILNLFSIFLEIVERNRNIKIILLTREARAFYDVRDVEFKKIVKQINLRQLDKKTSKKLLKCEIDEKSFENIYRLTKGVPLFLELVSSANEISANNINNFIDTEIFSKLTPNERNLLSFISVFRYPVPLNTLLIESIKYEDIISLVNRLIISHLPFNNFEVHDVIREFMYLRLSKEEKEKYHKIAGEYYIRNSEEEINPIYAIEAIYHLQKSKEWKRGIEFALKVLPYLISEGYLDIEEILDGFPIKNLSKENLSGFYIIKGDLDFAKRRWQESTKSYKKALEIIGEKSDKKKIAEIHGKLGKAQMNIKHWEETLNSHERALKIFKEMGNERGVARKYIDIGLVHKNKKDFNLALDYYNKGLKTFTSIDDIKGIALAHNNIALLYQAKGKFNLAEKHFEISKKLSEKEKDFFGIAITIYNLGELYFQRKKFNNAINCFVKGMEAFKKAKNIKNEIFCLIRAGDVYLETGNFVDSLKYYLNAHQRLEKRHEKIKLFSKTQKVEFKEFINLWNKIAYVYEMIGDKINALEYHRKALVAIENQGKKEEIAKKFFEIGKFYEKFRDLDNAIFGMERSLKILEDIKDTKGIVALNLNLGRIFWEKGEQKKAKELLRKALDVAKTIKDNEGVKIARKELEKID